MILVDSSVWIQVFSKSPGQDLVKKISSAKKKKELTTCGLIFLEVVRGARNKREYDELSEEFQAMNWVPTGHNDWFFACEMGFQLAKHGWHPPATDLLIAAVAIQNKCRLLHRDRDFDPIARYFPLRTF